MARPTENVKHILFFLSLALTLPTCKTVGCSPPPFEEGSQGSLVCTSSSSMRQLVWQVQREGKFINVTSCNIQGQCQNQTPSYWASGQISSNGTEFKSVLTISSVNRSESVIKCVVDGGTAEIECSLDVYVMPENPTCSSPVIYSDHEVALSCNTSRVYPDALCIFSYLHQNALAKILGRITYRHAPSETSPGDQATVCTVIIEANGLLPATYQLSVEMFPKMDKVPIGAVVTIANVPDVVLRTPTVAVSKDCPNGPAVKDGYIDARFGSKTTCTCELEDAGFPPGQALWYTTSGVEIGLRNSHNGSSDVTLTYNPDDSRSIYECRANTVLNATSATKLYQPLYAVGPSSVATDVLSAVFNLCPINNEHIIVACKVSQSQVYPEPRFSVVIGSQTAAQTQTGQLSSTGYSYSYSFRPQSGGSLQVSCRAENSIFPEVNAENMTHIEVREPPKTDPQILVSAGGLDIKSWDIISIQNGGIITVTCLVEGGFPTVLSVTLTCGRQQRESTGSRSILQLAASNQLNGQICYCHAIHITSCYENQAQVTLLVAIYPSSDAEKNHLPLIIGLSVGLGALAVAIVSLLIIILRRRKRRGPSRPPTYVEDWVNRPDNVSAPSLSGSLSGYDHPVYPPSYSVLKAADAHIYDEIRSPPSYSQDNDYRGPAPHQRNLGLNNGYIQPIS